MNQISICITTYNRCDCTLKSFEKVLEDERIKEVVIVDDYSETETYLRLADKVNLINLNSKIPKIKLYRNESNLGMLLNKFTAITLSQSEYCIILDSDNEIDSTYIDAIYSNEWSPTKILAPSFAKPNFRYTEMSGVYLNMVNVKEYLKTHHKQFTRLINTCNYFVNKQEYVSTFENNSEMKATDTVWFNYLWIKKGNSIYVTPNMEYLHAVHEGSGWNKDKKYNQEKFKQVLGLISNIEPV